MWGEVEIERPLRHQLNEASRMILNAFRREAFTAAIMDLSQKKISRSYLQVIRFKIGLYRECGQPLLAALSGTRVVGMAVLQSPRVSISRWRLLGRALPVLPRMLGLLPCSLRAARLRRLMAPPGDLPRRYYTLDLLAVDRPYRGKGIGRALLEQAAGLCAADETASGIYLLTGDDKNRILYQRSGYDLWETRRAGPLRAHHMFRARPI